MSHNAKGSLKIWLINIFLFLLSVASLYNCYDKQSPQSYYFSIFILFLFVVIYSTTILDYKVFGHYFSISKRINHLETVNAEIKDIVTNLVRLSLFVSGIATMPEAQVSQQKIGKYIAPLRKYLNLNNFADINSDLDELESRK